MITFNGESEEQHGLHVSELINTPAAQKNINGITIPGRDGSLYIDEGTYKDITIEIKFNFISKDRHDWGYVLRNAKQWLNGSGNLQLEYDMDFFYKVKYFELDDASMTSFKTGEFKVKAICDPYSYYLPGQSEVKNPTKLFNKGETSNPIYKIIGEGECTLTVNGKSINMNVGQQITLDAERQIAYREDKTSANTSVTGDYEILKLPHGDNIISITDGFKLIIIPAWRYL